MHIMSKIQEVELEIRITTDPVKIVTFELLWDYTNKQQLGELSLDEVLKQGIEFQDRSDCNIVCMNALYHKEYDDYYLNITNNKQYTK